MAAASQPKTDLIALEGEIDLHRSAQVRETLAPLIARKAKRILLDLSRVTYIDSSGLAVLIETLQRTQSYGGQFAIFGLQESVKAIFSIARLDQIFRIFSDETAAVDGV